MPRLKKVKEWNRPECSRATNEINKALNDVGRKLGISIGRTGSGSYNDSNFTFKIECSLIGENGEVKSKTTEDFKRYANLYGLKPTDLHREFKTWDGRIFKINGLNMRSRKYPISAIRVIDGKSFKFGQKQVEEGLARK